MKRTVGILIDLRLIKRIFDLRSVHLLIVLHQTWIINAIHTTSFHKRKSFTGLYVTDTFATCWA